jgi:hypothetical protein
MGSKEHPSPVTYRHQRYTQTAKHHRIPFHIRKYVEKELQRLEDLDIIEQVDGPTA